ncbi:beta-ketoacyl synthase N-terminal-like domain-containing protein [Streptococcus macacae]|uniref:3-oxoacyl-[acyl-carrier-protein] synthase 1 n=1 Tax=Streptococcus macacae NCTC 11558 TaxID=764298 RepID=G5JUF1_9STRE|nr:beta-ketoacyl synthase N-terminal-like domain-containing protein [Streptococcus macacae]EHJ52818.1 beta-ketoacyl synthase, N-terminal domain protein [Streptococcus macacae NCTC 11558]SUN78593.1 3-oxoacyl-ACP synthase [Streptococcus macacae NCTC 11558]
METVVITGGSLVTEEINYDKDFLFPVLKLENANYKELIGGRGLRYLTDATKMSLVAAKMAKENAQIEEFIPERSGVVVATNFSSMSTIVDFDKLTLAEGPRSVGAMQGPNLVLNATAAKLGIHFNISGFNTTISTGRVAALDALEYAYHMIQKREVDLVIVTGVEEFTPAYKQWLAETHIMSADQIAQLRQLGGTIILESQSHAKARGAKIYGQILKFCSTFDSHFLVKNTNKKNENNYEEYHYLMTELSENTEEYMSICIADNHLMEDHQDEIDYFQRNFKQTEILPIYDVFGGELFGSTGIAQILYSLQKFQEEKGAILCNDWSGNFKGLSLSHHNEMVKE